MGRPLRVGPARCAATLLVVGDAAARVPGNALAAEQPAAGVRAAVLDLDGPGVLVSAVAARPGALRAMLDRVVAGLAR